MQLPTLARVVVRCAVATSIAGLASAQSQWTTDAVVPKARAVHAAAFDLVNNTAVMFGGNANAGVQGETWLWSPFGGWVEAVTPISPSPRAEHAMAYDLVRGEVVLFGGTDGTTTFGDTWIWNGFGWRNASPPPGGPSARLTELAYDSITSRVLMFGGQDAAGVRLNDTWAWNGFNWQLLNPTTQPPARVDHAMASHWGTGRVVMFGGWSSGFLGDTWLWDGFNWVAGSFSGPSARSEHKLAFDGTDVILFGGDSGAGRLNDAWRWTNGAWLQVATPTSPGVREEHVLIDMPGAQSVLLYGGWHSSTGHLADTWRLSAGQWVALTAPQVIGCGTHAMAHDSSTGTTLLFGGYQDQQISGQTWSRAAAGWQQLAPVASPAPRVESAMAFDPLRNEFVLFGGTEGSNQYADTWVFRGGNWQRKTPANSPSARWGHAMVFDAGRGTVVLHAGHAGGAGNNLLDTWEWNGVNWLQISTSSVATAREDHVLVWDAARGETLLFGGWVGGSGFSAQTYVLRNGNWVQLFPIHAPSPRSEHMMAYDPIRERTVMFGGEDATGRVADTWEWNGVDWAQRVSFRSPKPREEGAMVFDSVAGRVMLVAGWDLGHFTDTWHFGVTPPATSIPFGTGCAGLLPATPALVSNRPWLGDDLVYTATSLRIGAPTVLTFGLGRLNVPLDTIGMPGCFLATNPILSLPMSAAGTTATLILPLPAMVSLSGAQLSNQAATAAPGANALGLLTSNGVEITAALR